MGKYCNAYVRFCNNEKGLGTLEILLILAVLVVVAIVFREYILEWIKALLGTTDSEIMDNIELDSDRVKDDIQAGNS